MGVFPMETPQTPPPPQYTSETSGTLEMASPLTIPQHVFLRSLGALFSIHSEITCFFIAVATLA
jgi:hypothetical protein